jgi:hypothetical protein
MQVKALAAPPQRAGDAQLTEAAHSLEVLWCVNAELGLQQTQMHRNTVSVPQNAQLLERLNRLKWAGFERGEITQKPCTIAIDTDVTKGGWSTEFSR